MIDVNNFEEIRPYYDSELNSAITRLIQENLFPKVLEFLFPIENKSEIIQLLNRLKTVEEFQKEFMHPALYSVLKRTSGGLSFSGFEQLKPGEAHLFISNHRDIVLDSAILQIILIDHKLDTSFITFGSNLMSTPMFKDFSKINKMITVNREGTGKEFYLQSKRFSSYIRKLINEDQSSVWISQRNGRAKDGDDKTQTGLLKMLHISGDSDFKENIRKLNIVPMAISYEFEPCDFLKAREKYISSQQEYVKGAHEDMESVIKGITQNKGRIHLSVCKPVNPDLHELTGSENEQLLQLASIIDSRINKTYKLWPSNYIAADRINNSRQYSEYYSEEEKNQFNEYMQKGIEKIKGVKTTVEKLLLTIYANPVFNQLSN